MVDIYIRTRGLRIDYSFVLKQPPRAYSNDYKSDIEKPTCILERTQENGIYLFLSGIPSQRKDHQGTPIRYELVVTDSDPLTGSWNNNSDEEKDLIKGLTGLIWMWLKDVRSALQEIEEDGNTSELVRLPIASKSESGKRLDQTFPSEYVEELLQLTVDSNQLEDNKNNLDQKLKKLISQIPAPPDDLPHPEFNYSTWWGGVNNDNSCNQWIKLVKKLLQDETAKGKALLLNIATPQSLGRLSVNNHELRVLLAKEYSRSEPKEIKIKDLPKTDTDMPEFVENLLRNPEIPEESKKLLKNFAENGIQTRKQFRKLFFYPQSD